MSVLKENLDHHIKEEEEHMFKKANLPPIPRDFSRMTESPIVFASVVPLIPAPMIQNSFIV
jgi:hypothetical protein